MALCRSLQMAGLRTRFAQMKVGKVWGGHIVIETEVGPGRWAVLDALYDLSFKRPDGRLASFQDVHNDWPYYAAQVPPGYAPSCCYQDVRYTNWTKIPVVMPLAHAIFVWIRGAESVNTFSLRTYFVNLFRVYQWVTMSLYLLFLGGHVLIRRSHRGRAARPIESKNPGRSDATPRLATATAAEY